jgi:DNA-binding LacI/PurR family transcriptional regulator
MAGRAPTIRDVASRARVSVATASNVVNGNRPVGQASRQRVVEAIATLGYRLDRSASALRGKSTRLVGMVVPDITNVFFASLVHGVEALAERDDYDLLIVSSSEDAAKEHRRIEALVARRIDGLIVVPANDDSMTSLMRGAGGSRLPRRRDIFSASATATSPFSPIRSISRISNSGSWGAGAPWPRPGLRGASA